VQLEGSAARLIVAPSTPVLTRTPQPALPTVTSDYTSLGCDWGSMGANPAPSCSGSCVAGCCASTTLTNAQGGGRCPTSSCHANDLGDQELNCPKSANCPVRDTAAKVYNASCVPIKSDCRAYAASNAGIKCIGYVSGAVLGVG